MRFIIRVSSTASFIGLLVSSLEGLEVTRATGLQVSSTQVVEVTSTVGLHV